MIVAEAQETLRRVMMTCLEERNFHVVQAGSARDVDAALAQSTQLLILDETLFGARLLAFLEKIHTTHPDTAVIVTTHRDDVAMAIASQRHGVVECLAKPFAIDALECSIEKAIGEVGGVPTIGEVVTGRYLPLESLPSIQRHPVMRKTLALLSNVADSEVTVLICGESGVGKEAFAQTLHAKSRRRNHRLIDINCASLPANLLESELFGSERGAFTGALTTRVGKFELAQKGTILLDEVSEMDLTLQAKMLRVIQEKSLYRVGGDRKIALDVRIVATTNRDLRDWVKRGNFREDLFYRLNVIALTVPPLRERLEDIPVLAQFILERFNRENRKNYLLTMEAIEQLCRYSWPGNIRELENILFLTAFLTPGRKITRIHFDEGNPGIEHVYTSTPVLEDIPEVGIVGAASFSGTIEEMEREMIRRALVHHTGNRTHAATALGISVRTLRNKLRLYPDLDTPTARSSARADVQDPPTECH